MLPNRDLQIPSIARPIVTLLDWRTSHVDYSVWPVVGCLLVTAPSGHAALRDEIAQLKRQVNHVDRNDERRRREQTT